MSKLTSRADQQPPMHEVPSYNPDKPATEDQIIVLAIGIAVVSLMAIAALVMSGNSTAELEDIEETVTGDQCQLRLKAE
jgi:hypothetical protein